MNKIIWKMVCLVFGIILIFISIAEAFVLKSYLGGFLRFMEGLFLVTYGLSKDF